MDKNQKTAAQLVEELSATVTETQAELHAAIEEQKAEVAKTGVTSAETAKRMDQANSRMEQLADDMKGAQEKYAEELAERDSRIDELEANFKRMNVPGVRPESRKSAGEIVAESETMKQFVAMARSGAIPQNSGAVTVPHLEVKAGELLTTEAVHMMPPMRDDLIREPQRRPRIRDLMPSEPIMVGEVDYIEMVGFHDMTPVALAAAITETGGVATVTTAAAHGLIQGDIVRLAGQDPADYIGDWFVTSTPSTTTFTFAITGAPADTTTHGTWLNLTQRKGAAAAVAEGSAVAQSQLEYVRRLVALQEIGTYVVASRNALNDVTYLAGEINTSLAYAVDFAEEEDLLYGDGAAPNVQGIMTHPRILNYAWSQGLLAPVPDTKLDAIRRAATLAHRREFFPSGAVVHTIDAEHIETAKSSDGTYLWIQVPDGRGPRVWRMQLVETNAILAGEAVVGSFSVGSKLYDRQQVEIQIGQPDDFFQKRLHAIMATKRLVAAWKRPDSFVKVTFDAAPS